MAKRPRPEPLEPITVMPVVLNTPEITPEELARVEALLERKAKVEDHLRNAPHSERYAQELLAINKELGVD